MAELSGNTVSITVWSETSTLQSPCPAGFSRALPSTRGCFWGCPRLGFLHVAEHPLSFATTLWNATPSSAKAARASDRRQRGLLLLARVYFFHCQVFPSVKIKTAWLKSWKLCFPGSWLKICNPNNIDGNSCLCCHRLIFVSDSQWNWFLWFYVYTEDLFIGLAMAYSKCVKYPTTRKEDPGITLKLAYKHLLLYCRRPQHY